MGRPDGVGDCLSSSCVWLLGSPGMRCCERREFLGDRGGEVGEVGCDV